MRTDYVFEMYKRRHGLTLVTHGVTGAPWYIYGTRAHALAPLERAERSARRARSRGHIRGLEAGQGAFPQPTRRAGCGYPSSTRCHADFWPRAAAVARLGSRAASRERQRTERPVATLRASRGRGFCMIVEFGPAFGAHEQTIGQSVHGKASFANQRIRAQGLERSRGRPSRQVGNRERSRKARSRVKAAS